MSSYVAAWKEWGSCSLQSSPLLHRPGGDLQVGMGERGSPLLGSRAVPAQPLVVLEDHELGQLKKMGMEEIAGIVSQ